MDQEEVNVLQSQALQAAIQAGSGLARTLEFPVQFGGDEKFFAIHPAGTDPVAHAFLIAVLLCRVHMAVAVRDRLHHGIGNLGIIQRPCTESQLRDLVAIVEFNERGDCHGRTFLS
ncbi:hypothetical protein D9M72_621050 [compost metagenome]